MIGLLDCLVLFEPRQIFGARSWTIPSVHWHVLAALSILRVC